MEILSPAGNIDILKSAITNGADAVYFESGNFNARRNAKNFTKEDIKEAVRFAHIRDKKLYLTLNTIIYDKEINSFIDELKWIASSGIDALIVQDLGCINILREVMPQMPLHASTQMSAHNLSDCIALKKLGFERVVLAREMSFDEIKKVTENVDIETEIFVHGALCMCVSGQCYFSSSLGERSGNRGLCAQVCRLPFYVNNPNRYNLSLKDLSALDYIQKLKEIGVTSLKIEGRMKGIDYVILSTSSVKKALEGKSYDKRSLREVFSRSGFTNGYLEAKLGKDMFGIRREEDKAEKKDILKQIVADFTKESPSIPINVSYEIGENKNIRLDISDEKNDKVSVLGDIPNEAKNKPVTKEEIESRLSKLGNTPYYIKNISGKIDSGLFVGASKINEMRRNSIGLLDDKRSEITFKNFNISSLPKLTGENTSLKRISASFSDVNLLDEELLSFFDKVYLPVFDIKKLDKKLLINNKNKIVAQLPRIYFEDENKLKKELILLKDFGIKSALCHTLGKIYLAKNSGYDVEGGFGLNISNSYSIDLLKKEYDIKNAFVSPEVLCSDINKLKSEVDLSVIAYGHFPLMITRNCPVAIENGCRKNNNCFLYDRKGKKLQVKCSNGTSEIFNPLAIYIGDKKNSFKNISEFNFYFTYESKKEIINSINLFKKGEALENTTRFGYFSKKL